MNKQCILELNLSTNQSRLINDVEKILKKLGVFEGEDDYISIKANALALKVTKKHENGIHRKIDNTIDYLERIISYKDTKKIGLIYGEALNEDIQLFACNNKIYLVKLINENEKHCIAVKSLKNVTYKYYLDKTEDVNMENIIETNVALSHYLEYKK
ncbi:hypothetical protein U0X36_25820 [Bacillus thuringiensis]|uniref:hypothetical protein n=1 Tax=Bacillus thuringiensis TaxID=1428 RepID=UPI000E4B495A|nr:hypothetical protein [Bacillus thuringiensis]MDZ3956232.1 hypothetical protein [Bacillus thuringiensis]RGP42659.1 hypothetical protein BTW32_30750 [Bacillus thuringiensis]